MPAIFQDAMARSFLWVVLQVCIISLSGCGTGPTVVVFRNAKPAATPSGPPPPPETTDDALAAAGSVPAHKTLVSTTVAEPASEENPAKGKNKKTKKRTEPMATSGAAPLDAAAARKITEAIQESVDLGPTLAVWLLDRTSSARQIVGEVAYVAQNFYDSPEIAALNAGDSNRLLTAVIAFDDKVEFLLDPPSGDAAKVHSTFEEIQTTSASREHLFAAVKQALEKYLPLRSKDHRQILFIVATDEAGDDGQLVDGLIEPLRKHAIPLYAVGLQAPWGQSNPFAANPKAIPASQDERQPTVGPETLFSERVDIESRLNIDLVDSGYGPFALERLCRASYGQFVALHAFPGSRGANTKFWPTGTEMRFDNKVLSKYAPDYISAAAYEKSLLENKAKAVIVEAAKLPKFKMDGQPGLRFQKDAEAKMATKLSEAQRYAARNSPAVEQLVELLSKGEKDRGKLNSARWQAEFDLTFGRVLAIKTRLDGYNSMIAALKRGKTFQNADSKAWMLEPADNYETESTIKRQADKAKMYLERVVHDHPGTPWAKIAEDELKTPLGWSWRESP